MPEKSENKETNKPKRPRVLADFGGRRKIFERRMKRSFAKRLERRTGNDRRSGFDRRAAHSQYPEELPEKRKNETE